MLAACAVNAGKETFEGVCNRALAEPVTNVWLRPKAARRLLNVPRRWYYSAQVYTNRERPFQIRVASG